MIQIRGAGTERQSDSQRQLGRPTESCADRQSHAQTDRKTNRQADRGTYLRQTLYAAPRVDRQSASLLHMGLLDVANAISNHLRVVGTGVSVILGQCLESDSHKRLG